MPLFEINPTVIPPEQAIANSLLAHADRSLSERIAEHSSRFHEFWDSPVPPSEIAAQMGAQGARYLACAQESVGHISNLAALAEMTLDDVMSPTHYMPRLPLVANEDGTVSVIAVDGLDDWGRPLPPAEQDPEPEHDQQPEE